MALPNKPLGELKAIRDPEVEEREVDVLIVGGGMAASGAAFEAKKWMSDDQTVLLVDCDLRRQKIHNYLGLKNKRGLVDYLIDDRPLNDLITWPNIPHMTLISGGRIIRESTELLGSPKMKELVREMKARYDDRYVLFDVSPILAGADAAAFAPLMDGVVVVVEAARTTKKEVKKALSLIPQEKLIGVVLNKSKARVKRYKKYY